MNLILDNLSDNLRQVVSFGAYILKWDVDKKRKGKDRNVPSIFLRNSIELGDAISLLIKRSSIDPAKILLRSLMESNFGLLYMIEKNEELRSHSFLVCRLNKEIRYYKQFLKEEEISKNFIAKLKKQEPHFELENYCNPEEIKKVVLLKQSLLLENLYQEVNSEYERTCNKKRKEITTQIGILYTTVLIILKIYVCI